MCIATEQRHTYCRTSHLFWVSVWGKSLYPCTSWNLSSGFALKVSSNTIHLREAHSPPAESQKSREYLLLAWLHRYSWIWESWKCCFSLVEFSWSQLSSYALRTGAILPWSTQTSKAELGKWKLNSTVDQNPIKLIMIFTWF